MDGLAPVDPPKTRPANATWGQTPPGYRPHEESVLLGSGTAVWSASRAALLGWAMKTRSGFDVAAPAVVPGDTELIARLGPLRVREPIRVLEVLDQPDRVGYAYATLPGHPVRGEEAFVIHRDAAGVHLTLRSLTAPPSGLWLMAYPLTLLAQRWYRGRYRRALRPSGD